MHTHTRTHRHIYLINNAIHSGVLSTSIHYTIGEFTLHSADQRSASTECQTIHTMEGVLHHVVCTVCTCTCGLYSWYMYMWSVQLVHSRVVCTVGTFTCGLYSWYIHMWSVLLVHLRVVCTVGTFTCGLYCWYIYVWSVQLVHLRVVCTGGIICTHIHT